jgi:hypothetical protein
MFHVIAQLKVFLEKVSVKQSVQIIDKVLIFEVESSTVHFMDSSFHTVQPGKLVDDNIGQFMGASLQNHAGFLYQTSRSSLSIGSLQTKVIGTWLRPFDF